MKTDRKKELKKQITKLDRKERERTDKIRGTDEYKKLEKEEKRLEGRENKLYGEIQKIKADTNRIYLIDDGTPKYTNREGYWSGSERNIRKETLNGIKRALGITNLSSLKGSEIEGIVEKLIDTKLNNNKEYQEKVKEYDLVEETIEDIDEKKTKLIEVIDTTFWKRRQELHNKLGEIERRERIKRDLKNPKKREKAKRWKKEEEAREKLKNVPDKLEEIHNEVIKERIVTNLEEENGEEK